MEQKLRPKTVKIIGRMVRVLVDEGIVSVPEERYLMSNLKHLIQKGSLRPVIAPKLITQQECANMLGICLANFKKQERNGTFGFSRRMVGTSVRYRNVDVLEWIMSDDDSGNPAQEIE